jgi:2-polyprenyl-6-methoxyphenol hydroxylase-like FAD-dependent oxidoreductase
MHNASIDTDVLIVGGGLVGLFLANECARRGLRWRLVKRDSRSRNTQKPWQFFLERLKFSTWRAS